jgi:uncharacterized protein with ATP-grasp and redox domains
LESGELMREEPACIPCYLKQVINTLNQTGLKGEQAQQFLRGILPEISAMESQRTPAENSTILLHKVNESLDNRDPFCQAKQQSNDLALKMLPQLKKIIEESADPLRTACQLSIAGNIIDMGIFAHIDVEDSIRDALVSDFARNDYPLFKKQVEAAGQVLIIGDNSGEIAFDRLLAEQLQLRGKKIVYAVKGGPIINDATRCDAEIVGMAETAQVIDNGNNCIGTILKYCSPEFCQEFFKAEVIISKGQGNFETLESTPEAGERTFFLLRAKCSPVARKLEVNLGDMALCRNRPVRQD